MHYVIYLPDVSTSDSSHLPKVGLADQAEGADVTVLKGDCKVTDRHTGGALVSWGQRPPLAALPGLRWLPAMPLDGLKAERYFVGVDDARPPQPHELLRVHPFPGSPVGLGDGHLWVVPHARELPFDVIRNPSTGTIEQQPRPQFYAFWTKCAAWQRMFQHFEEGDPLPSLEEQVEFLEESLRLNYRLTPEVIAYLKLFNTGPQGTLRATLAACLHVQPGGV